MQARIYFLDNLRTFLIFLVVLLHAGIVYERVLESNWLVIDPIKNDSIGLVRMYLDLFVMFIIFYISGYFIPYSLKGKNAWDFIKSKFNRIMVPWIIAVFTLIPLYKVIFLYSRGLPQEEWFSYFHLFKRSGTDLSFFANDPSQSWLWFLPILFLFQVIYFGLSKTNLLSMKISLKTGVILTFIIGILYSVAISFNGLMGWTHSPIFEFQNERLLIYFMAFLLGSLCFKLNVFESNNKHTKYYILSNVVLTFSLGVFTVVALNLFFNMIDPGRNYFFVSESVDKITYYITALLSMLSFLHIFIHLFRFNFNKSNWLMSQFNKNSYQVYIIHIIVMGVIALLLVDIVIPSFVKYFLLTILTFIISNILIYAYHTLFKNKVSLKIASLAIFVIMLFTFISKGNERNTIPDSKPETVTQTNAKPPSKDIFTAALFGDLKTINQHIQAGTNLNQKDDYGSTALIIAATFGKTEVARALVGGGADLNMQNNDGATALHTAAFLCRTEIVKILIDKGADKNIKNNFGSTALESVIIPFADVKSIYDQFSKDLGPFGLKLDYKHLEETRPIIVGMLKETK